MENCGKEVIYISEKKELYENLFMYFNSIDKDKIQFHNLIYILNQNTDTYIYKEELFHFLSLITNIANNHHNNEDLFFKIENILLYFKDQMQQTFSKIELFNIFKDNKKILLFLFDHKIIPVDKEILQLILYEIKSKGQSYGYFFIPEFKSFFGDKKVKGIEKQMLKDDPNIFTNFEEKRHIGENSSYLCSLIRQDLIEEFVKYIYERNISFNFSIKPSIFETNIFLIDKELKLIEYAAFFGSIQIVTFLQINNVELNPSLWYYVIHSNNAELIHFLEDKHVEPPEDDYDLCLKEAIICHHNNIANYICNHYIDQIEEILIEEDIASAIFSSHNYQFFPNELYHNSVFFHLNLNGYETLVNYYMISKEDRIIDFISSNNITVQNVTEQNGIDVIYYLLYGMEEIDENSFEGNKNFTRIVIPDTIKIIKKYAFQGFSLLEQISIPSSVSYIGKNAFINCKSLKQISIPINVKTIENNAFSYCSSLIKIMIPFYATLIGDNAFFGCKLLKNVPISNSVSKIGNKAFKQCTSLVNALIPFSVKFIGVSAFEQCSSLKIISLPPSLEFIGNYSFSGCTSLEEVSFGTNSALKSIGNNSFERCSSLSQISFPSSLQSIGNYSFSYCSSLKEISFGANPSIESIGDYAFNQCKSFVQFIIPSSVVLLGKFVFKDVHQLLNL